MHQIVVINHVSQIIKFHLCFHCFPVYRGFEFQPFLISLPSYSSIHSRMRSKRLRTTEEPVGLGGSSALSSSKRKGLGGPSGPKVRKSVTGTTCKEEEKEKKKDSESKHNQNQNSVQLSGKRLTDGTGRYLRLWISLQCEKCTIWPGSECMCVPD